MNNRGACGDHLLHFHVDQVHFSLTAANFVNEATEYNMRVQYRLSPLYKFRFLTDLHRWNINVQEDQLLELPPYLPHPAIIRKQTLKALDLALKAGYEGLWLLLWVPEIFPNYDLWLEAEDVWTDLSMNYPITILCSFDLNESECSARLDDMYARHSGYYKCNSAINMTEIS